jgi:hypothetical protein
MPFHPCKTGKLSFAVFKDKRHFLLEYRNQPVVLPLVKIGAAPA